MNGLDLFSGIGGLALALEPMVTPVAYCEIDRYAQSILLSRMASGHLPKAPIWDDIRTLGVDQIGGPIDIVYGGFPCQDISSAGKGAGLGGERSGLYWEIHRIIKAIRPEFVFLENVPAIRTRGLKEVVWSLSRIGYDCRWTVVSAAEVGAPHLRKRWFLLAYSKSERRKGRRRWSGRKAPSTGRGLHSCRSGEALANTDGQGLKHNCEMHEGSEGRSGRNTVAGSSWWDVEPDVGRVANGVSNRVDRLRGLGNAVVPAQAKTAFMRLMGDEI